MHALRLHWVEGNSKHYEAGVYVRAEFISGASAPCGEHAADYAPTAIRPAELRAPEREAVIGGKRVKAGGSRRTVLGACVARVVCCVVPRPVMSILVWNVPDRGSRAGQQPDTSQGSRECGGALPRTVPAPISARDAWLCAREQMDFFALRPREDVLYKPATG